MIEPNVYALAAFSELWHAWLVSAALLLIVWAISFGSRNRRDP